MRRPAGLALTIALVASGCSSSSSNSADAGVCQASTDAGSSVGVSPAKTLSFDVDCTLAPPQTSLDDGGVSALALGDCASLSWSFKLADGTQISLSGTQIAATANIDYLPYSGAYAPPYNQGVGEQLAINLEAVGFQLSDGTHPYLSVLIPEALFNDAGVNLFVDGGLESGTDAVAVGSIDLSTSLGSTCWYQDTCANVTLEVFGADDEGPYPYVLGGVADGQQLTVKAPGQSPGEELAVSASSLNLLAPLSDGGSEAVCGDGKIHYQ
jgi:hypothetical protein